MGARDEQWRREKIVLRSPCDHVEAGLMCNSRRMQMVAPQRGKGYAAAEDLTRGLAMNRVGALQRTLERWCGGSLATTTNTTPANVQHLGFPVWGTVTTAYTGFISTPDVLEPSLQTLPWSDVSELS